MTTTTADARPTLNLARRVLILVSGVMTVALYFTSILVASTVLPQMQGTFSATPDEISWAMTFNILATAIAMPMTGWLVARFGRKSIMVWSTGIFTFATLMCGLAPSLEALIFWRIVQGAAGAPSVPLVQTILLDTFPQPQHRMVLGIYGMGVVLGPIIGPTMGGYLAEIVNWRWSFYCLIPVGCLATLGLSVTLPPDPPRATARLNWLGFILLSIAIGGMQLVFARGERLDWLQSAEIQLAIAISVLAFYLFIAHSLTSAAPFIDLRLLRNRNYALGLMLITIFGMLNFTPMVLLPTLMRVHMGYPDMLVGQVVGARGLGGIFGFFAVIFLERLDPRLSVGLGFALQFVAGFWLMTIDLNVTPLELALNGAIQGLSSGIIVVALTLVTFTGIQRERMPEAVSVYHLLRNIGASLFISVSVAEVVRSTGMNYAQLSEIISPYNKSLSLPWVIGPIDLSSLASLERLSREVSRQAAMIAYINAFGLFTAVSAVALPLVLLMQRHTRAS
ncbi:MAG: DHA2 family efflux MFS transporter permease subunit [Hyphomicrobiaceae bacterium]